MNELARPLATFGELDVVITFVRGLESADERCDLLLRIGEGLAKTHEQRKPLALEAVESRGLVRIRVKLMDFARGQLRSCIAIRSWRWVSVGKFSMQGRRKTLLRILL